MLVSFERIPASRPLFNSIQDFERDLDSLFEGFLGTPARVSARGWMSVGLRDSGKEFVLTAELPGVKKEDLKLSLQNSILTISCERKAPELPEGATWLRNEIRRGSFHRAIELPSEVKSDAISAELEDGILRVVLPKAEAALPREIKIR